MPAAALSGGASSVSCTDGAKGASCGTGKWKWDVATTQASAAGSSTVLIDGKAPVLEGDAMASHPDGTICTSSPSNHAPKLSSYSSTVFADGKAIGRVGDVYNSDDHMSHTITTGSETVFIG